MVQSAFPIVRAATAGARPCVHLEVTVQGAVQGVGFRPFVYRLATELRLSGEVRNSGRGVVIDIEGAPDAAEAFMRRLRRDKPPLAQVRRIDVSSGPLSGERGFSIRASDVESRPTAAVLPDTATCGDCLRELFDPSDRRHRYPFLNCTNCGPRYSIITALPYDRGRTTMAAFVMCPDCEAEYHDPANRRFHAQPNACPACGPRLAAWDAQGRALAQRDAALKMAVEALREGRIVAAKGIGGFHLLVDAGDEAAVRRLRQRKQREEKPLAVLYPSLSLARRDCVVSSAEAGWLRSPEAPIVLLPRRRSACVAASVAPGNPWLGVMLPSNPLHHLLMASLGRPAVATSGNLTEEPICTDERDALRRLAGIADLWLVHDRPIARHVDDSIVRRVADRRLMLRRSRGFAPLSLSMATETQPMLAVGGQLKNAVAVADGRLVTLSQHIGDLETRQATDAFTRTIGMLTQLRGVSPRLVASDAHPDYQATRFAQALQLPLVRVQHHYAHVLSCMADNALQPPALGIAWDGTGYGLDGTVWGGEFLLVRRGGFQRLAALRPFRLAGAERAVREPRRAALGLLIEAFGDDGLDAMSDLPTMRAFRPDELAVLRRIVARGVNAPVTSSVGRLFDALASILDVRQRMGFEGQAAMELEAAAESATTDEAYPMALREVAPDRTGELRWAPGFVLDWAPLVCGVLQDRAAGVPVGEMAAKIHNALAEAMVAVAARSGQSRIVLSGGCFQNRRLTEQAISRLRRAGFRVFWHRDLPPNDGGISVGQVMAAAGAI